jgi:hypothetical protein
VNCRLSFIPICITRAESEVTRDTATVILNDIIAVWGITTGTKLANTLQMLLESSTLMKTHNLDATSLTEYLSRPLRETDRCFACMSPESTERAMKEIEKQIEWLRDAQHPEPRLLTGTRNFT